MKKVLRLENLDCANCAAKIERGILKIEGIEEAHVDFLMQKMTLVLSDGADAGAVLAEVKDVSLKVEPDLVIKGI